MSMKHRVSQMPLDPDVDRDEVQKYMELGHWGYILDYRTHHRGDDPDPDLLVKIAEAAESVRCNKVTRFVKGVIDVLT
jgi:hypothetical protein